MKKSICMMKIQTSSGNFLVKSKPIRGLYRYAYFSKSKHFIRYTNQTDWDNALGTNKPERALVTEFSFPPLGKWALRATVVTKAGRFNLFWRWERNKKLIFKAQSKVEHNKMILLYRNDHDFSFTNDVLNRINLIQKWNKDGKFSGIFDYKNAVNYDFYGPGSIMPHALINLCLLSNYDNYTVYRAIDMIGIKKPDYYTIEILQKDGEEEPWGIKIYLESKGSKATYIQELKGEEPDDYSGKLLQLEIKGAPDKIYIALLWLYLFPIRERFEV